MAATDMVQSGIKPAAVYGFEAPREPDFVRGGSTKTYRTLAMQERFGSGAGRAAKMEAGWIGSPGRQASRDHPGRSRSSFAQLDDSGASCD